MIVSVPTPDPTPLYRVRDGIYAGDLLIAAVSKLDLFSWLDGRGPVLAADLVAELGLAERTAELRGLPPGAVTAGQTTYDLRRLKTRGLITRIPHSHRYTVTDHGLHTARFLTCVHDRFLPTGLAHLTEDTLCPPLRAASRAYNDALENLSRTTGLAA